MRALFWAIAAFIIVLLAATPAAAQSLNLNPQPPCAEHTIAAMAGPNEAEARAAHACAALSLRRGTSADDMVVFNAAYPQANSVTFVGTAPAGGGSTYAFYVLYFPNGAFWYVFTIDSAGQLVAIE